MSAPRRTAAAPRPADSLTAAHTRIHTPVGKTIKPTNQGVGQLFPWNAFITAGPYFAQRFCGTAHAEDFENYFSLTFMLTNLVGQALCVRYARFLATSCGSVAARVTCALASLLLVFLATAVLALFKVGVDGNGGCRGRPPTHPHVLTQHTHTRTKGCASLPALRAHQLGRGAGRRGHVAAPGMMAIPFFH